MLAVQQSFHVVNFIEEIQHEEFTYLVTKFVRGGDLLNYLQAQQVDRLEEAHAFYIFSQIARGVHDIHHFNIVHRDLKHLNIFLSDTSSTPKVRIGDFGMAAHLNDDECIKKVAGTIGFMAPEVVLD